MNSKHGGHILGPQVRGADELASKRDDLVLDENSRRKGVPRPRETPFDYLFQDIAKDPASHLPAEDPAKVVADLKALGAAMVDPPLKGPSESTIPPVYTYWGVFVDHDVAASTARDKKVTDITTPDLKPLPPVEVTEKLRNSQHPVLDLEGVYGNGPKLIDQHSRDAGFYDGVRFRLGKATVAPGIPGERIPPVEDLNRDLPRIGPLLEDCVITEDIFTKAQRTDPSFRTTAFIGDARNDATLINAQLHVAFLRFHNQVVEAIQARPAQFGFSGSKHEAVIFERARELTRWHYQWIVVNDWLRTITSSGIVDKILLTGPKHYRPRNSELYMPLEYSVAGFRFGHSMVRDAYDYNRNFGTTEAGPGAVACEATMDQVFQFTGHGFERDPADATKSVRNPFRGHPTLPFNWIIEWDRFTDKGSPEPRRFARKIDTHLAPPLRQLVNEGNAEAQQTDDQKPIRELLRFLTQRDLLRGYLLSIPTGQAVAKAFGVTLLSDAELRQNNTNELTLALEQGGFFRKTPLLFYILKEAEVRANGNSLGEVGSRLVAETIIGLLVYDRHSYLNHRGGWNPSDGVTLPNGEPIVTILDFLRFAGVAPRDDAGSASL